MKVENEKFKIIIKFKEVINLIDLYIENIPKKDIQYKNEVRSYSLKCFNDIVYMNNINDVSKLVSKRAAYCANISTLSLLLEVIYDKRYINEKNLEKYSYKVNEINKMMYAWIESKCSDKSKV